MNLSKEKILSVLRNIPAQARFILEGKSSQYIVPGKQVFLSPYGLGDTFILCLFAPSWEKKHGRQIHFLIKPSHLAILKGFGRTDYTLVNLSEFPLHYLGTRNSWNNIQSDEIFVAHMRMHRSCRKHTAELFEARIDLMELYRRFLGVAPDLAISDSFRNYYLTQPTQSDLSKTIFLTSTANTLRGQDADFWTELKEKILAQGFSIIENSNSLSLSQILSIGFQSHRAITFRSGLSDMLHLRAEGNIVLYPDQKSFEQYSLKKMFNDEKSLELIASSEAIEKILGSF